MLIPMGVEGKEGIMKLKQDQIISLVIAIITVILTGVVHIGIREWYKADIRYVEGTSYTSSDRALTSLALKNFGHADAEKIRIWVSFDQPILEVTTSDPGLPFTISPDSLGKRKIQGIVERLVPGDTLVVYFSTAHNDNARLYKNFVNDIVFHGGKGKTGTPLLPKIIPYVSIIAIGTMFNIFLFKISDRRFQNDYEVFAKKLDGAVTLGFLVAEKGQSEQTLQKNCEKRFGKERFRKETLFRAAEAAFKARAVMKPDVDADVVLSSTEK